MKVIFQKDCGNYDSGDLADLPDEEAEQLLQAGLVRKIEDHPASALVNKTAAKKSKTASVERPAKTGK